MNLIKDLRRSLKRVEGAVDSWNTCLLDDLARLKEQDVATDVEVVVVEDNGRTIASFRAHSLVLAASSPSLASLLASAGDDSEGFTLLLPGEEVVKVEKAIKETYLGEGNLLQLCGLGQREKLSKEVVKEESPSYNGGQEDFEDGHIEAEPLSDHKKENGPDFKGEEEDKFDDDDFDDRDWFEEEESTIKTKKKNLDSPKKAATIPCQEPGCDKMFVTNDTHLYHLKKFHNINKYDQERFIGDKLVRLLPNGRFQCPECEDDFSDRQSLKYHIMSQHENKKSTCHFCGKKMALSKETLKRHIERFHSSGPSFFCDQCDYSTSVKKALKYHMDSKHDPTTYTCKECGKSFNHKITLAHHMDDKHLGRSWVCEKCGFPAKSRSQLYTHKRRKHGPTNFACVLCEYVSASTADLEDHKRSFHLGEITKQSPSKNNERKRKERESQLDFTCHICNVKKNSRQMLSLHIKADHEGIRFNCIEEGCDFSAKQKSQLKIHVNVKHLRIKVHCELCDYTATQVPYLNNHMLKKHGVKPFSCDKCSFRCYKKERMQCHLQSMHSP